MLCFVSLIWFVLFSPLSWFFFVNLIHISARTVEFSTSSNGRDSALFSVAVTASIIKAIFHSNICFFSTSWLHCYVWYALGVSYGVFSWLKAILIQWTEQFTTWMNIHTNLENPPTRSNLCTFFLFFLSFVIPFRENNSAAIYIIFRFLVHNIA